MKTTKVIQLGELRPRPTCLFYGACIVTTIAKNGKIHICTVDDYKACPLKFEVK